ncbi:MAG: fumarylacetoacetase [Saprospiraceae bacterium]
MKSWLPISPDSDFSLYNLPYGVFDTGDDNPRPGIAIGDHIVDLRAAAEAGLFGKKRYYKNLFAPATLNDFIREGKAHSNRIRKKVQNWLCKDERPENAEAILVDRLSANMYMPIEVGDYTDFYSSIEHATNVGKMFRPDNPLLPNWKWIPVGYHGRSSSIVVSGTPIKWPSGQTLPPGAETPVFGPSKRMDFELEMAFVVGKDSPMGEPITVENAEEHIFGMVLFNDWSARDIQRWEYVPLGPFLGKNFASSMSPWIVPLEALKPFKVRGPKQNPAPLEYLKQDKAANYDIHLEVAIQPENTTETVVCRSNFRYMYWSMIQQLVHHTVNGCNVRVGDLMASGTISGKDASSYGSMLELSWGGKNEMTMADGSKRSFLQKGDTVHVRGWGAKKDLRVGFGEVSGKLV